MTYRERREARADRLRGWADKREAKSAASFEQASLMADQIPFGQPILVGHYSEGRDRRYRDRIGANMDRGLEHARKADSMRSRADNIDAAAAHAIYSDDPDAVEALRAKIAGLEAARARIAAYNVSCRTRLKTDPTSTHGDLELLDAGQRADFVSAVRYASYSLGKGGQFPRYHAANLSGLISASRARLARLERP